LSEDQEDGRQQVEEDPPHLLKRALIGAIAGIFVFVLSGGLLGTSVSIWEGILGTLGAGGTFGSILVVGSSWLTPEDRFKWFSLSCIAGGAAGTAGWLIAQPSSSMVLTIGSGVLLGALFYLFG
jgi:hypothetical protein